MTTSLEVSEHTMQQHTGAQASSTSRHIQPAHLFLPPRTTDLYKLDPYTNTWRQCRDAPEDAAGTP